MPVKFGIHIKKHIYDLEMIQNRATRFIFNIKGRETSISETKKPHNISTLESRRKNSRARTLLRIIEHDNLHPSLSDVLTIDMYSNGPLCLPVIRP